MAARLHAPPKRAHPDEGHTKDPIMATIRRPTYLKKQKEQKRQAKAAKKREARQARRDAPKDESPELSTPPELGAPTELTDLPPAEDLP
jgi:hypothetical protein